MYAGCARRGPGSQLPAGQGASSGPDAYDAVRAAGRVCSVAGLAAAQALQCTWQDSSQQGSCCLPAARWGPGGRRSDRRFATGGMLPQIYAAGLHVCGQQE